MNVTSSTITLPLGPTYVSSNPTIALPGVRLFGAPTAEQLRKRKLRAEAAAAEAQRLAVLRAEQDAWNYSVIGEQTQRAARRVHR